MDRYISIFRVLHKEERCSTFHLICVEIVIDCHSLCGYACVRKNILNNKPEENRKTFVLMLTNLISDHSLCPINFSAVVDFVNVLFLREQLVLFSKRYDLLKNVGHQSYGSA